MIMASFKTTFVATLLLYFSYSLVIGCAQQYEYDYSAEARVSNWQSTRTRNSDSPSRFEVKTSSPIVAVRSRQNKQKEDGSETARQYTVEQAGRAQTRGQQRTRQRIPIERRVDEVTQAAPPSSRRRPNRVSESTTQATLRLKVPTEDTLVNQPRGFVVPQRDGTGRSRYRVTEKIPTTSSPRPVSRGRVKAKIYDTPKRPSETDDISESDNYPPEFIERLKNSDSLHQENKTPRKSRLRQRAAKTYPAIAISEANQFRPRYSRLTTKKSQTEVFPSETKTETSTRSPPQRSQYSRYTTARNVADNSPIHFYRRFSTTEKNEKSTAGYTTTISPRQKYLSRLRTVSRQFKPPKIKQAEDKKKEEALEPAENAFYIHPNDMEESKGKMKTANIDLESDASEENEQVETEKTTVSPTTTTKTVASLQTTRHRISSRFSRSNRTTPTEEVVMSTLEPDSLVMDSVTPAPINLTSLFDESPDSTLSIKALFNNSFNASSSVATNKTNSHETLTNTTTTTATSTARPSTVTESSSTTTKHTTKKKSQKSRKSSKSTTTTTTTAAAAADGLRDRPILRNIISLFGNMETTTRRSTGKKKSSGGRTNSTATTTTTTPVPREIEQILHIINETMEVINNRSGGPAPNWLVPRLALNALTPETSAEEITTHPTATTTTPTTVTLKAATTTTTSALTTITTTKSTTTASGKATTAKTTTTTTAKTTAKPNTTTTAKTTTTAAKSTNTTTNKSAAHSKETPKKNCTSQYVHFDINSKTPIPQQYANSQKKSTTNPTTSTTADYFVFGIYPNNTVVRKRAWKTFDYERYHSPYVIFGIYPNNTIVKKFPNGTIINDEFMTSDNEVRDVTGSLKTSSTTTTKKPATTSTAKKPSTTTTTKKPTTTATTKKPAATTTTKKPSTTTTTKKPTTTATTKKPAATTTTKKTSTTTTAKKPTTTATTKKPAATTTTKKPSTTTTAKKPTTTTTTKKPATTTKKPETKTAAEMRMAGSATTENVLEDVTTEEESPDSMFEIFENEIEREERKDEAFVWGTTESTSASNEDVFDDRSLTEGTTTERPSAENIESTTSSVSTTEKTTRTSTTMENIVPTTFPSSREGKSFSINGIFSEEITDITTERASTGNVRTTESDLIARLSDEAESEASTTTEKTVSTTDSTDGYIDLQQVFHLTTTADDGLRSFDVDVRLGDGSVYRPHTTEVNIGEVNADEPSTPRSVPDNKFVESTTTESPSTPKSLFDESELFGSTSSRSASGNLKELTTTEIPTTSRSPTTETPTTPGSIITLSDDFFGPTTTESSSTTTEAPTTTRSLIIENSLFESPMPVFRSSGATPPVRSTTEFPSMISTTTIPSTTTPIFQQSETTNSLSLFGISESDLFGSAGRRPGSGDRIDESTTTEAPTTSVGLHETNLFVPTSTETSFTTTVTDRRNSEEMTTASDAQNEVELLGDDLFQLPGIESSATKSTVKDDEQPGIVNLAYRALASSNTITTAPTPTLNYITSTMKSMNYKEKKVRMKMKRTSTSTPESENVFIVTPETIVSETDYGKKGKIKFVTLTPGVIVTTDVRDENDVITMSSQHVQKVTKAPANIPDNVLTSVVGEIQQKSSSPIPDILKNVEKELQGNGISVSLARRIIEMAIERAVTTEVPETTNRLRETTFTAPFTTTTRRTPTTTTVYSTTTPYRTESTISNEISTANSDLINTVNVNPLSVGFAGDYTESTTKKMSEAGKPQLAHGLRKEQTQTSTVRTTTMKSNKKTKSSRNPSASTTTLSQNDKLLLEAILKQQNSNISVQELDKIIENQIRLAEEVRKASKNMKRPRVTTTTTTTTTQTPPLFGFLISLFSGQSSPSNIPVTRSPNKQTRSRLKSSRGPGSMSNPKKTDPLKEVEEGKPSGERSTRGELVTAAIDVTKAVSKFMGTFLSSAAQSFQAFFSNFGRGR